MPDVDQCVRECEAALSSDIPSHSQNIYNLPHGKKALIFRGKTVSEIEAILRNCKETIQKSIVSAFYPASFDHTIIQLQESSTNNRVGADLLHTLPNNEAVDIEVKFGQKTDKALGMKNFAIIFDTPIFSETLNKVARKQWLSAFIDGTQQSEVLVGALNRAIDHFNTLASQKNQSLSSTQQQFAEKVILNTSGDGNTKANHYLSFILKDTIFTGVTTIPTGLGSWTILPVKKLSNTVKRVNIFIKNKDTGITIKFTLNWKNNYKGHPAKLGLGSPSWNVWVLSS